MHGFGTFLWTSGQRFDGEWQEGRRDGVGVKQYSDGSTFDGLWKEGKKHGVGLFRPKVSSGPASGSSALPPVGSFRKLPPQGFRFNRDLNAEGLPKESQQEDISGEEERDRKSPGGKRQARGDSPPPLSQEGSVQKAAGLAPLAPRSASFRGQAQEPSLSTESVVAGPAIPPKKKDVYIRKFENGKLIREDKLDKVCHMCG